MGKALTIVLIIILVVVVGFGGAFAALYLTKGETPSSSSAEKLTFDENAGAYVEKPVEEKKTSMPGVAIPGWEKLTIPADTETVSVDFFNPEQNSGNYYMTFELKLADGESLYKSGLVKAGQHIQTITLAHGLSQGSYDAVLHVQPYLTDAAQTPVNNADIELKLIAK